MEPSEVAWRDTMRPVRFYGFDARLLALLTIWLFLPGWWTTVAVVLAMAAFRTAEAAATASGRARRAACNKREAAMRAPCRSAAAVRGFWLMRAVLVLLLLAAADPAAAAFRYIPPGSSGPDTLTGETAVSGQPVTDAAPEQTGPVVTAPDIWRVHPGRHCAKCSRAGAPGPASPSCS